MSLNGVGSFLPRKTNRLVGVNKGAIRVNFHQSKLKVIRVDYSRLQSMHLIPREIVHLCMQSYIDGHRSKLMGWLKCPT